MVDPSTPEAQRIRSYFGKASWRPSAGSEALVAERRRLVERLVREKLPPLGELAVCDVGCGTGADLAHWRSLGVAEERLSGTELVAARAEASRRALPGASIAEVDNARIPFPDGSFDVVTASVVLSSILDADGRRELLHEMRRVARVGGVITVYDFVVSKPWNRNVAAVSRSELESALGPPTEEHRVGPFLPVLDLALRLPHAIGGKLIRVLPRTHRLWVWTQPA